MALRRKRMVSAKKANEKNGREKKNGNSVERAGQALALVVGIGLLAFALVFLMVYPNREVPAYSELIFSQVPVLDGNVADQAVYFSVRVNCFEQEETAYHVIAKFDDQIVATKDFVLLPTRWQEITFSVPVKVNESRKTQVKVTLTRASTIAGKADDRIPLEVFAWLTT